MGVGGLCSSGLELLLVRTFNAFFCGLLEFRGCWGISSSNFCIGACRVAFVAHEISLAIRLGYNVDSGLAMVLSYIVCEFLV